MNDTFSVKRFGWLFKKTLLERPAQLMCLTALSFSLSLIIYAVVRMMSNFDDAQNFSFLVGLVGGGCFLASFVFGQFTSNASGSSFLTLPASVFEKWLCGVVITGILYLFLFLIFFRLMDMAFVGIYHNGLDPKAAFYQEQYNAVHLLAYDELVARSSFIMFFNFAGIMLVGSLYFNKAAFIKVALITCGICVGAFLLNLLIAKMFFSNMQTAFPYYMVWLMKGKERGRMELPEDSMKVVAIFFRYLIPAMLWFLAFMRLREKEF